MAANEERLRHPSTAFAAIRDFFLGLGAGCVPLLIVGSALLIDVIVKHTIDGPLRTAFYVIPCLLGMVCLATLLCLIFKKFRSIGWGLLLALLVTLLAYAGLFAVITTGLD